MRRKHKLARRIALLVIAAALIGSCVAAAWSETAGSRIQKITGKNTSQTVQTVKQKTGKALGRARKAAVRIRELADRLIEKAGGKDEIARKVKTIIARFGRNRSRISSTEDIELTATDSSDTTFRFTYGGEKFRTVYSFGYDTWTIYDSYKITNEHDMKIICQALIDIHPVHGSDLVSYRTAEDMAYEWKQHNIVYDLLPDGNRWRSMAKDVDLDPYDQGRSYAEIYEDRTGKKFNIKDFV